jgi:hypothetical protein
MSSIGVDAIFLQDPRSLSPSPSDDASEPSFVKQHERVSAFAGASGVPKGRRRTPRKSLIVVLPDNHVVSPEQVSDCLPPESDDELVDVILACAGQPLGIAPIQRRVRDLQVLLAPAGTSTEDLRELAMSQAPGDIVTLLSGSPFCA